MQKTICYPEPWAVSSVGRICWDIWKSFHYYTWVTIQEAKYVERWPNTTSAWAGWSRLDIQVDRYDGVHSLLICTSSPLGSPTCHKASQQGNTCWTKYQKAADLRHFYFSLVFKWIHLGTMGLRSFPQPESWFRILRILYTTANSPKNYQFKK